MLFLRPCHAVGFALILGAFACPNAGAEERMAWRVDRYDSDVPEDADTVILTYGIPETDAVAFEAMCGGADGATPRAIFWYDTVDLDENQDVVLSLSVGDLTEEVPAKVYGKDAEVGVSGLRALLSATAPLWEAMANDDLLTYGIAGGEKQELHLTGAANALRKFTAACSGGAWPDAQDEAAAGDPSAQTAGSAIAAAIDDLASRAPRGPVSPKVDAVSCDRFGTIKSERSEVSAEITFVNKADGYRGLVWIDTDGTPVDHTGINQGETVVVPTFETHAWMITDGPGNCIEMVVAEEGGATFEITAPATVLGPGND
ncbi:hypothetical protein AUC70_07390 [Methyloceanibacter stevinii]|uniref:von Hippel-Lindau disease tumour suppressor beta domain-containing protein n=1 Tax=Methyloceanibacter stevinii TaxID=1774970 RepID=A0A1E3VLU5_9HYPH|nr:hypothetical protein [Methyloceanibacter stevinii]ODR94472.1 hypothetical protein AUC70_07390 [Methyloceanibacter stevinii]